MRALVHHQLLTQDLPEDWPITSFDPQPSLGPARFVICRTSVSNLLKHVSHFLGEDITNFSSHSLRIGGRHRHARSLRGFVCEMVRELGVATYLIYPSRRSQGHLFAQHMVEQDLYIYGEPSGHGVREPAQPRVGVRMASAF